MSSNENEVISRNPIEYIGGVMDEETRPLLKAYINNLKEGEGVLVVYRLAEGTSPDVLLESNIQQISGQGWNYVSDGEGDDPMQVLVNNLSKNAMDARVANAMFSQGGAKIKAFDEHKIAFGIVGNGKVTSIKGVVHQQLNMGLNGDLLLHEGDIILRALVENNVFIDENGQARPLKVKTYGAGGSSSSDTNPGIMRVSDGVIDIRTHVDPRCIIDHFDKEIISSLSESNNLDPKLLNEYKEQLALIEQKMMLMAPLNTQGLRTGEKEIENKGYTGIEMVHDMAELSRKLAAYTGKPTTELILGLKKRYYGEITFGTANTGVAMIHRMETDAQREPFIGDDGQIALLSNLQNFLKEMSSVDQPSFAEAYEQTTNGLNEKVGLVGLEIDQTTKKMYKLLKETLDNETKSDLADIELAINNIRNNIKDSLKLLFTDSLTDLVVIEKLKTNIQKLEEEISIQRGLQQEIVDEFTINGPKLLKDDKLSEYKLLNENLLKLEGQIQGINNELIKTRSINDEYKTADRILRYHIEKDKQIYNEMFPTQQFGVTASGNIFFTDKDKESVGHYGAKTVEMENHLFIQIINHSVANKIYIDKEYITKIAADPLKIESHISEALNDWAKEHTMTVNDYVEAFMWADNGQSFKDFPMSGRWTAAEKLFENPLNRSKFYNFGTSEEKKDVRIINPFWKEIGTDLVKEIQDGKAFTGEAFANMNFEKLPLSAKKQELQALALKVINHSGDKEELKQKVTDLFTNYLTTMTPMRMKQIPGEPNRFRVYARRIPVLKTGYVKDGVSDWDQPLYKSTNTAVLDVQSASFLKNSDENSKTVGGGRALLALSKRSMPKNFPIKMEGSNSVLVEITRLERAGSQKAKLKVVNIAKNYIRARQEQNIPFADDTDQKYMQRIEGRVIKAECEALVQQLLELPLNQDNAAKLAKIIQESQESINTFDVNHPTTTLKDRLVSILKAITVNTKCEKLIGDIDKCKVSANDRLLKSFVADSKAILAEHGVTTASVDLQEKLEEILQAVNSDEVIEIKNIIQTLRQEDKDELISIGKGEKATLIETALQQVPVQDREHVFSDKEIGKEVREALASQRHIGKRGDVYKKGDEIDVEKAPNTYKRMHSFFTPAVKPGMKPEDIELSEISKPKK